MGAPVVVCVGVAVSDTIAVVQWVPREDERLQADEFVVAGGGPAATAAVTLSRLGIPAGFCGLVGDDPAGEALVAELAAEGVDTSAVERRSDVRTAASVVLVSAGTAARTIVTSPPLAPAGPLSPPSEAEWIHVDHAGFQALAASQAGHRTAVRISVDGGNPVPGLSLAGVTLYAPTVAALLRRYPGGERAAVKAALRDGADIVVATRGAGGALVGDADGVHAVPACPVDAVSTLGAGDVFHGALLAGLVEGRVLADAVRRANACAALSCRALDARSAIPTRRELDEFVRRRA